MATLKVWLSPYSDKRPADLIGMDQEQLARNVAFTTFDMAAGYTLVGTAEVQITLTPRDELVQAEVAALNARIKQEHADHVRRVTELTRKLNELLALEMAA